MSEEKKVELDDKLKGIKEKLIEKEYVLTWDNDDKGSSFKVAKKEWDFTLWKENGLQESNKWPHNSLWIRKEDEKYICELAWWAVKKYNEDRGLKAENCVSVFIKALVEVCRIRWDKSQESPKFKPGDQSGIRIRIAELSDSGDETKFVNDIVAWEKSNMQDFIYIQDEMKKGKDEIEIENIKQRLIKEIQIKEYLELLINNHNIILHGAPGTGKTYLAKQIAKDLIFTKEEHDLIDKKESDIAEADKPKHKELKEQFNKRCGFVQFHQSYDYTDFVEGLRPVKNGTDIGFELRPGVFKEFCKEALEKMNESVTVSIAGEPREIKMPFVFIIDEINRGEMSKIFGELFFSVDPGYRGKKGKIKTQYANLQEKPNEFDSALGIKQNVVKENGKDVDKNIDNYGHFFVPENVYIIGTMNDIDRSVESMDFAMRRRFAFEEISADNRVDMLEELEDKQLIADAKNKMKELNEGIEKIDGLTSAYHIGPAYFLKLKNYKGDFDLLWEYHIEGVVMEYLRGMDNAEKSLIELKKAYFGAKSVDENHNN